MEVNKTVPAWIIALLIPIAGWIYAADESLKNKNVLQDLEIQELQLTIKNLQEDIEENQDRTNQLLDSIDKNLEFLTNRPTAAGIEEDGIDIPAIPITEH